MQKNAENQNYVTNEFDIKSRNTQDAIYFNFSYSALKLLGKNLYSNPANAISELVANSLDAHAPEVYVYIDMSDKEHSSIEIIDNGKGMDYYDLSEKYVWIGRNKRKDSSLTDSEKQTMMGRKGIGKLAALYLSNQYYIITKKTGDSKTTQWEINLNAYDDSAFPKLNRVNRYIELVNKDIWNNCASGTVIKLENVDLRGNGEKKIEGLRRVFADFYLIDSLKTTIYVAVKTKDSQQVPFVPVKKKIGYKNFYALYNNTPLKIVEKMQKSIAFTWASKYPHIANTPRYTKYLNEKDFHFRGTKTFSKEDGSTIEKEYCLSGWIAIHSTIESANAVDPDFIRNNIYQPNHLRLYVRNKLAVENYFTLKRNTQTMANYIEGEISFDILDDDDLPDIATSSRQDFLADERVELLISLVEPILASLFKLRNQVGHEITQENNNYTDYLIKQEEKKRKAEEEARAKAEEEARIAEKAKEEAEKKQKEAEEEAKREKKRSQYILSVSNVEDKNLLNTIHTIYNMSNRVKENLDELNSFPSLTSDMLEKLEKASTSNQRILSASKIITKAGYVVYNNDVKRELNLSEFVNQYANNVLCRIYDEKIDIKCVGNVSSIFKIKIKPLSFIMLLDNLIGNSIKANSSHLFITIEDSDKKYYLKFKDDGNGIDPSITNLDYLFDFGVTTTNGSGLGLYYAKKQMTYLKGNISIERNSDKGVTVILSWDK